MVTPPHTADPLESMRTPEAPATGSRQMLGVSGVHIGHTVHVPRAATAELLGANVAVSGARLASILLIFRRVFVSNYLLRQRMKVGRIDAQTLEASDNHGGFAIHLYFLLSRKNKQ